MDENNRAEIMERLSREASIGDRIRSLRKGVKLSQVKLAELMELSPSTVGMYEQGRRKPEFSQLEKMSKIFNVSIDYLVKGEPKKAGSAQYDRVIEQVRSYLMEPSSLEEFSALSDGGQRIRQLSKSDLEVLYNAIKNAEGDEK